MTIQKIAIPSNSPGGLECERSDHFGHCELFTIVTLMENEVNNVHTIENVPHGKGGCLAPVNVLKQQEVNSIVVAGIGRRPLVGLQEAGIKVYLSPLASSPTVKEVVEEVRHNNLPPITIDQACKNNGNCHDH